MKPDIKSIAEDELQLTFIKQRGPELNFECPFCVDGKPDHFNINAESGAWLCFKCGERGNLRQLVDKLGDVGVLDEEALRKARSLAAEAHRTERESRVRSIFLAKRRPSAVDPRTLDVLEATVAYCEGHFSKASRSKICHRLAPETLERFRIGVVRKRLEQSLVDSGPFTREECVKAGVLREFKGRMVPRWVAAVLIPYVDAGRVATLEYRLLDDADAKKYGKYQSLPGPRALFNIDALKASTTILVCEGAIDTMTAEQLGVAAAGVPGHSAFKPEWAHSFVGAGVKKAVLCFDNGEEGTAEGRRSARKALEAAGVQVFDAYLPEEVNDINDFVVHHDGDAAKLREVIESALTSPPAMHSVSGSASPSLPTVIVNKRATRDVVSDAWDAVLRAEEACLTIFRRDAELVRIRRGHVPRVDPILQPWFERHLCLVADWMKQTKEAATHVAPPTNVLRMMMAQPDERLLPLEAVVTVPFFDRVGSLVTEEGYHAGERVYLVSPDGWSMPSVPSRPTAADIEKAKALLFDDLLVDFDFVGPADRAHAVAAMMLPFVRAMITGPTPMHLCEAPGPGSGKTLLFIVLAFAFLGSRVNASTLPRSEDETRKRITALLATAPAFILFDNVDRDERGHRVESSALASALTTTHWTDRRLGVSEVIECVNRATWLVTGNNVQLSMELSRRAVLTRIDPGTDEPWRRKGFKHEDLVAWARAHRGDLVWAVLTLVQSWISAGKPRGSQSLGTYEDWAAVVGGILTHVGIEGFLENLDDLYEASDGESLAWREFVTAWWTEFGDAPCGPTVLAELCHREKLLTDDLEDKTEHGRVTWLGGELVRQRDRVYAGYRILLAKDRGSHKGRTYKLEPADDDSDDSTESD